MSSTPPTSSPFQHPTSSLSFTDTNNHGRQIDQTPIEILRHILSSLPLQTFITSRYVCRSWNQIYLDLIQDPVFVLRHSNANKEDPHSNFLIVCQKEENLSNLYLVDNDTPGGNSLNLLYVFFHQPSDKIRYYWEKEKIRIIGSANGLICLSLHPKYDSFLVCNPITREILELPNPKDNNHLNELEDSDFTGFVFDETNEVFKVVYTRFCNNNFNRTSIFIHTLGSGVLRFIEGFQGLDFYSREAVFLKDAFHLTTKDHYNYKRGIGVINIGAETTNTFELPSRYSKHVGTLRLVKGCLGWIEIKDGCGIVWIMKDYGVAESWSKEYVIAKEEFMPLNTVSFKSLKKNGVFLREFAGFWFGDQGDGVYYYVDKEEPSHVHQSEDLLIEGQQVDVFVHAGSLLSPKRVFSTREMDRMALSEKVLRAKRIDPYNYDSNAYISWEDDELSSDDEQHREMVLSATGMDPHDDDLNAYDEEEDTDTESLFSEF